MENPINKLPSGDFEVAFIKMADSALGSADVSRLLPLLNKPYEFARDVEIEIKIANDKREREQPTPSRDSRDMTSHIWLRGIIRSE